MKKKDQKNDSTKHICGYSGYTWALKSENLIGKSQTYLRKQIKNDPKFKNRKFYETDPLSSIYQDNFVNPKKMDQIYNYIPTKKKFRRRKNTDIDHDNILAQSLKLRIQKTQSQNRKNNLQQTQKFQIQKKQIEPIIGYAGFVPHIESENLYGKDYQQIVKNSKNLKLENLQKSLPPLTKKDINSKRNRNINNVLQNKICKNTISGYTGFRPHIDSTQNVGKTFQKVNKKLGEIENYYTRWNKFETKFLNN